MISINSKLAIPDDELQFTASRGGGPGGQHVNKVASRVTLQFDVLNSPSLTPVARQRIASKLAGRVSKDGILQLSSHASRSQAANKAELIERFAALVREALRRPRVRKATRPTRASRERRVSAKKRRAGIKRGRGRVGRGEE